ncbi:molybdopterin-dependent oxidoreductase [Serinicoccus sp. LYQ131]|uniref:molybdopterin-dependent oxidoreductase n=1 Tax=Serinicoccus sp. LYQ131 TaxID=3378797 RepID=UPI00385217D7
MNTPGSTTARRMAGAATGLVAGASGLLVGEGMARVLDGTGPVVAVGNRAVDLTPRPVKEWAITTFGAADKAVLIGGVLVTVVLAILVLGWFGSRRRTPAVIGMGVLVALAAVAMIINPAPSSVLGLSAGIGGMALVGVGGFAWMLTRLPRSTTSRTSPAKAGEDAPGFDRRRFLVAASTVAAAGAAGGAARGLVGGSTGSAGVALPTPGSLAPAVPEGVSFDVAGLSSHLTPTPDFYRVDTALQIPQVDVQDYVLRITGMVDTPLELTYQDLLDRELVERRITLTCVSNPVGGDLLGNATWIGIPMRDLLAEAGVQSGADAVLSTSVDGFTAGTPLDVLTDDREALVAVGMNGEPLTPTHGFPVRMVTPGLYGYVSATKWLTELEVTRFQDFTAYWTDRGYAAQAPIKLSSRIDVPASFAQLEAGEVTVAGVAWAQTVGIERVEVRVGDGSWDEAELAAEDNDQTWRAWRHTWDAEPGSHRIEVRATDRDGNTQTSRREPIAPDGSTGWHNVTVSVA